MISCCSSCNNIKDCLVSQKFLNYSGHGRERKYFNTIEGVHFLDKKSSQYMGSFLDFENDRYIYWDRLNDALKTAKPQSELRDTGT